MMVNIQNPYDKKTHRKEHRIWMEGFTTGVAAGCEAMNEKVERVRKAAQSLLGIKVI